MKNQRKIKIKKIQPKIKEISEIKKETHEKKSDLEKEISESGSLKFSLINPKIISNGVSIVNFNKVQQALHSQTAQTSRDINANTSRNAYTLQRQNEAGSYSTAIRQENPTGENAITQNEMQRQLNRNLQTRNFEQNISGQNRTNLERRGLEEEERQRQYEEKKQEENRKKYEGI